MENKFGPCNEKKCDFCCNPVKVNNRMDFEIPKDENGNDLWIRQEGFLAPVERIETVRIVTYICRRYDSTLRCCKDYESRPQICRNSSCISDPGKDIDEQYSKVTSTQFIQIKK